MNGLLICMSMCASCALGIYFILKKFLGMYLSSGGRYTLLLIVMILYLFPFPLLKYDFINGIRCFVKEEWIISALENKREYYIDLDKILLIKKNKIIFSEYELIFWMMLGIWLTIFSFLLINILIRYSKLRKYAKTMKIIEIEASDFDQKWFKEVKKRSLTIGEMKELKCAFTYGFVSPVVVLPGNICKEDKEILLNHELVHIIRFDYLVRVLSIIIVVLHFYNPLTLILLHEIEIVSELCCDKKLLENCSYEYKKHYGHLLISLAAEENKSGLVRHFSTNDKKVIKERVSMIKNNKPCNKIILGISIFIVSLVSSLPVFAYTPPIVSDDYELFENADWILVSSPEAGVENMKEQIFQEADYCIIFEDGTVNAYTNEERVARSCSHKYENAQLKKHIGKSDGSCEIEIYSAKVCRVCGSIKNRKYVNTITYKKCIHK